MTFSMSKRLQKINLQLIFFFMFQVLEYAIKGFFPKTDRVRKKYTINIKDLFLFAPFEQNEKTAIKFFFCWKYLFECCSDATGYYNLNLENLIFNIFRRNQHNSLPSNTMYLDCEVFTNPCLYRILISKSFAELRVALSVHIRSTPCTKGIKSLQE